MALAIQKIIKWNLISHNKATTKNQIPGSEPVLETQIRVIPSFSTLTVMKFGAKKFFVVGTVQSICRIKHPITH